MSLLHKTRDLAQLFKDVKAPRIVFAHVPKCGGSSIYKAIGRSMGLKYPDGHLDPIWSRTLVGEIYNHTEPEISEELQVFRHALLLRHLQENKRFIAGHFIVNRSLLQNLQKEHQVVTILRQPDKRLFSHFKYWMLSRDLAKDNDAVYKHWKAYIKSDRAKFQANLFSIYFGESNFHNIGEKTIETALSNLEKIDVVGDLENLDDFEARLSLIFAKTTKIGFVNTSKKLIDNENLDAVFNQLFMDEYELIKDMVTIDEKIYSSFFNKPA
jgi:hypothetical protein